MGLRPRRTLGQAGYERQEPRRSACQGLGEWAWTPASSAVSYQGSEESAKLVISEAEVVEEEDEPKEAEAGSQTDVPAAEAQ